MKSLIIIKHPFVLGIILGAGNSAMNKADKISDIMGLKLQLSGEGNNNKRSN